MEDMMFRVVKSIVLFVVMYFSLKFLGISSGSALVVSTIPLVLGILNVMTGAAYGIAAMVFIVAALSALLPSNYDNAMDFIEKSFKDVSFERGKRHETTDNKAPVMRGASANDKK
jgi:hypothetical protein